MLSLILTLKHFLELLNCFCDTCCGILVFFPCSHQFCYTLIKKDKLWSWAVSGTGLISITYNLRSLCLNLLTFLSFYIAIILPLFSAALPSQPVFSCFSIMTLKPLLLLWDYTACPFPGVASTLHPYPLHKYIVFSYNLFEWAYLTKYYTIFYVIYSFSEALFLAITKYRMLI